MTTQDLTNPGCWVLDRRVSLGFIFAVLLQVVVMTSWLVTLQARVAALEQTDARHDTALRDVQQMGKTVEGMRTDISWIRENLKRP